MDNPTALKLARALCGCDILCHRGGACRDAKRIAAALKRAYADGMDLVLFTSLQGQGGLWKKREDIRAEADQLEGK